MSEEYYKRFTREAKYVLTLAQKESKRLRHHYIGTEHLLLALVEVENTTAWKVLGELGATRERVHRAIEHLVGTGSPELEGRTPVLSPRTKRVLQLALEEAKMIGSPSIAPEHLLLGLVQEGEGVAITILQELGISPEKVRAEVVRSLMDKPVPETRKPEKQQSGKSKTPLLDQLAVDLTAEAEGGRLDPVVGRETEIERVIQILARRTKNNPALIGEPGVGKTAIVEGLAQRIVEGNVPEPLLNKRLLMLDVGSLVAGTMYRGQFEERMKKVIKEIIDSKAILFIDELHMLVGAGAAGSAVDAANILKPALSRGELQCIGATTLDEYRKYIESDSALERRFQPVYVEEPSLEETIEILKGIKPKYEEHHKLEITDEAIRAAAYMASRYVPERSMPDKAIDLIDEAASRVRMYKHPYASDLKESFATLKEVRRQREDAISKQLYEDAFDLRAREQELKRHISQLREGWSKVREKPKVTAEDVAEVVSMWTGVPVTKLATEESKRLLHMEDALSSKVVGQEEAIKAIAKAVRRARAGLKDPKRPIGTFIFLGPTGVGKTLLAKTLAEFMFGSEDALIKIDMSEFMERHNVSRLIGAPPGYVGYEEGGQLTEAVRRRPYSVILMDEIEKAHPDVFNTLLQIMEDGYITDGQGRRVDFRNTILIMTSNLGASSMKEVGPLGFPVRDESAEAKAKYEKMKEKMLEALKGTFRPEFLNRVDGIMVFHPLTRDQIIKIVDIELAKVRSRLEEQGMRLEVTEEAKVYLADKGYSKEYGARPLRRLIQSEIEDVLSEKLLAGEYQAGSVIRVDKEDDGLGFELVSRFDPEREDGGQREKPKPVMPLFG